jgi:hypothetical protein
MSTRTPAPPHLAPQLMATFATETGLVGSKPPRRYLWTDAFAVCNFLGLYRSTGEGRNLELALRLVDQVHHVLGRHRPDDPREGWLSGLSEAEGERHPTRGGLRIGKLLPERAPNEPMDARLEWDRDGQYFHYLTQWMHALHRVSEVTDQPVFQDWAVELAQTAHAAFVRGVGPEGSPRLVWKMSIGLDRPLVPTTGQHDPLDAWVTYLELSADMAPLESGAERASLEHEIAESQELGRGLRLATGDPLGAGALLTAAYRLARLERRYDVTPDGLLQHVLAAAGPSVDAVAGSGMLTGAAELRLAFRELGLSIGLHAFEAMRQELPELAELPAGGPIGLLSAHASLAEHIDGFWSDPANRTGATWRDHADINTVMLATSLAPDGYLGPI